MEGEVACFARGRGRDSKSLRRDLQVKCRAWECKEVLRAGGAGGPAGGTGLATAQTTFEVTKMKMGAMPSRALKKGAV